MTWTANTPVSRPIRIANIQPTVDLGGFMFSHTIGLMFYPQDDYDPITAPTTPASS